VENNNFLKNIVVWLVIGLVLMTLFNQFSQRQSTVPTIEYSEFMEDVRAGRVAKVVIEEKTIHVTTTEGKRQKVITPGDPWLISDLLKYNVKVEARLPEEPSILLQILISWGPMILIFVLMMVLMNKMQGGGGGRNNPFSFGKSRHKDETDNEPITFADVAGCDEAKEDVMEVVDFLRNPHKYQ